MRPTVLHSSRICQFKGGMFNSCQNSRPITRHPAVISFPVVSGDTKRNFLTHALPRPKDWPRKTYRGDLLQASGRIVRLLAIERPVRDLTHQAMCRSQGILHRAMSFVVLKAADGSAAGQVFRFRTHETFLTIRTDSTGISHSRASRPSQYHRSQSSGRCFTKRCWRSRSLCGIISRITLIPLTREKWPLHGVSKAQCRNDWELLVLPLCLVNLCYWFAGIRLSDTFGYVASNREDDAVIGNRLGGPLETPPCSISSLIAVSELHDRISLM